MVKLILVTGLPGTGKTTFARALATRLGAWHLNTDTVREKEGLRGQYDSKTKARVYQALQRQVVDLLEQKLQVVIDGTFYQQHLRDGFIQLAKRQGVDYHWIELRAEEACIRKRVDQHRPDSDADFSVFQKIKAVYEPLEDAHTELWSDRLSVEEMVAQVVVELGMDG